MDKNAIVKNFTNTYLYSKSDQYEPRLINFIMKSERIDKNGDDFQDIKMQVKRRQVTSVLYDVLESENVILLHSATPMPKSFKVTCVKDIKEDNKLKVFIDVSSIFRKGNHGWECISIDTLISHILSAMTTYIYFKQPNKLLLNSSCTSHGTNAFSQLVTHIINYLYKINIIEAKRDKCIYLSARYYLTNVIGNSENKISDSDKALAKKISKLSDREIDIIEMDLERDDFLNIRTLCDCISRVLGLEKLTVDLFMEKWIYIYGPGTHFGTEYFPAFAAILTDAYVGAYVNNQKTIEKIVGSDMVDFTKTIFRIGENVIR